MNAKDPKELAGEAGQLVGGLIECFAISCMSVNIMDAFLSPDMTIFIQLLWDYHNTGQHVFPYLRT